MQVALDLDGKITGRRVGQELQKPKLKQVIEFLTKLRPKIQFAGNYEGYSSYYYSENYQSFGWRLSFQ